MEQHNHQHHPQMPDQQYIDNNNLDIKYIYSTNYQPAIMKNYIYNHQDEQQQQQQHQFYNYHQAASQQNNTS